MLINVLYIKTHCKCHVLQKETSTTAKLSSKPLNVKIQCKEMQVFQIQICNLCNCSEYVQQQYIQNRRYWKYWKWKDIEGKNPGEKKMKVDCPLHFAASERNKHNLSSVALISPSSFMLTTAFLHLFPSEVKWNATAFRSVVQERSVLYYNIGTYSKLV